MTGIVKFFDAQKGWGFITPDLGGPEVFVHHTALVQKTGFRLVNQGDHVEYTTEPTDKGLRAINVMVIKAAPIQPEQRRRRSEGGRPRPPQ